MARWPQYTDDPPADYDAYCRAQEAELNLLPICCECGHRIEDERCWLFGDEPMCDDCAEQYRKFTSDLME